MSTHYRLDRGKTPVSLARRVALSSLYFVLFAFVAYGGLLWLKSNNTPVPDKAAVLSAGEQAVAAEAPPEIIIPMPWPEYGRAAYGVPEINLYASASQSTKPVPIASLAKVITVLAILQEKPLQPGEQGPTLTMTQEDVDLFYAYLAKDGTVVPVEVGSQITQYQALQATMHISANNMSDTLARWAFGSDEAYVEYANRMLKDMGIENTVVDDASGFSPRTASTPEDMVKIGYMYMKNPVLREIAQQKGSTVPVAGKIPNANYFGNQDGVVGIKIGFTEQAGRTYMAADLSNSDSIDEMSVAVVLGADDLRKAAKDARKILKAGNKGYERQ